jgi:hypothetical protein
MTRIDRTKAAYRAALRRLEQGRPTHVRPSEGHAAINVAMVCVEAGLSRNPLYAQHRDVLEEIHQASTSRSMRRNSADRRAAELADQLAKARSENLTLLFRLQQAEDRLRAVQAPQANPGRFGPTESHESIRSRGGA